MNSLFSSNLRIVNFLWLLLIIVVVKGTVAGATFTVTKIADTNDGICDSDCSLREAIAMANTVTTDDIIDFEPSVFSIPRTIKLNGLGFNDLRLFTHVGSLTINGT